MEYLYVITSYLSKVWFLPWSGRVVSSEETMVELALKNRMVGYFRTEPLFWSDLSLVKP